MNWQHMEFLRQVQHERHQALLNEADEERRAGVFSPASSPLQAFAEWLASVWAFLNDRRRVHPPLSDPMLEKHHDL
jgi:hypothetical protein